MMKGKDFGIIKADANQLCKNWRAPKVESGSGKQLMLPDLETQKKNELDAIMQQAKADGYKAGFDAGMQEGTAFAMKEYENKLAALTSIINNIKTELDNFKLQLEPDILKIIFKLVSAIVYFEISLKKEHIVDIVKEALSALPTTEKEVMIYLNPQDLEYIGQAINKNLIAGITDANLLADVQIQPGGCKIHASHTEIDATVDLRLTKALELLRIESV